MPERNVTPLSFFKAVEEIALLYVHLFKYILFPVFLASLIQALVPLLTPREPTVGLAVSILGVLVLMFLYAWILHQADSVYMNRPATLRESLGVAKKRFLYVLGVTGIFVILIFILAAFVFALYRLGVLLGIDFAMFTLAAIVIVYIGVLLAFPIPATVLDNTPILRSFETSAKLVTGHWWHTFGIMIVYMIPIILASLAMVLLPTRNLFVVSLYEFVYHILAYPLFVAVTLVLYHDLKARHQMYAFKHVND